MTTTASGIARTHGIKLAWESFGELGAPTIVLVCGGGTSREWWQTRFCELLADGDESGPRRVVRYDLRDSGQSTTGRAGEPDYTGADLVEDLAALVTELDAAPAHLIGMSLGGGLVQQAALRHPEAVASITLLSTSPAGSDGRSDDLPPPTEAVAATFEEEPSKPDWTDATAVAAHFIEGDRPYAGSLPLDVDGITRVAAEVVARAGDQSAAGNHFKVEDGPGAGRELASLQVPTLVMHGTEDPLFPLPHGERLADLISGACLVVIPGHGHQYPPPSTWDPVIRRLTAESARRAWRRAGCAPSRPLSICSGSSTAMARRAGTNPLEHR